MAISTIDLGLVKGATWYIGTAITGTATTATTFPGSGITASLVGDLYFNTALGNVYKCGLSGAANVAKWSYASCLKGGDLTISGVKAGTGLSEVTAGAVKTIALSTAYIRDLFFPPGCVVITRAASPASLIGGTWSLRTDTHMFLGKNVYERVS